VFYAIIGRRLSGALITQDGVVTRATPNCKWACGERIGAVLTWVNERGMTWSVSETVPAALLPALSIGATRGRHASHRTQGPA
jgi:hypothetical protein